VPLWLSELWEKQKTPASCRTGVFLSTHLLRPIDRSELPAADQPVRINYKDLRNWINASLSACDLAT
jgi:hypothetical protein